MHALIILDAADCAFSEQRRSAPFIGAGDLALLGVVRKHASLLLVASIAVIAMSLMSVVLLPLLIPCVVLIGYGSTVATLDANLVLPTLLAVALDGSMLLLVFHQDPVTWSSPEGGGGSSNIVTATEATFAIGIAIAVNLIAAAFSRSPRFVLEPERDSPEARSVPRDRLGGTG